MELEKDLDGMLECARRYSTFHSRVMGHCDKRLEDHFIRYMENKTPMSMEEFLYGCPPDSLSDSNLAGWVTPSKNILKAMNTLALPNPQFANLSIKDGNDSVIVISSESEEEMEKCNDFDMSGIEPLGDIETSGSDNIDGQGDLVIDLGSDSDKGSEVSSTNPLVKFQMNRHKKGTYSPKGIGQSGSYLGDDKFAKECPTTDQSQSESLESFQQGQEMIPYAHLDVTPNDVQMSQCNNGMQCTPEEKDRITLSLFKDIFSPLTPESLFDPQNDSTQSIFSPIKYDATPTKTGEIEEFPVKKLDFYPLTMAKFEKKEKKAFEELERNLTSTPVKGNMPKPNIIVPETIYKESTSSFQGSPNKHMLEGLDERFHDLVKGVHEVRIDHKKIPGVMGPPRIFRNWYNEPEKQFETLRGWPYGIMAAIGYTWTKYFEHRVRTHPEEYHDKEPLRACIYQAEPMTRYLMFHLLAQIDWDTWNVDMYESFFSMMHQKDAQKWHDRYKHFHETYLRVPFQNGPMKKYYNDAIIPGVTGQHVQPYSEKLDDFIRADKKLLVDPNMRIPRTPPREHFRPPPPSPKSPPFGWPSLPPSPWSIPSPKSPPPPSPSPPSPPPASSDSESESEEESIELFDQFAEEEYISSDSGLDSLDITHTSEGSNDSVRSIEEQGNDEVNNANGNDGNPIEIDQDNMEIGENDNPDENDNDNGDQNNIQIGESDMEICENQACNEIQVNHNEKHDDDDDDDDDDDCEPPSKKSKTF